MPLTWRVCTAVSSVGLISFRKSVEDNVGISVGVYVATRCGACYVGR